MRKLGTLEPVIYFVNAKNSARPVGHILLAPYSDCPTPDGYRREYVDTLAGVDSLQKQLIEQERRDWEREAQYNEALVGAKLAEVRDRLYSRMVSSSTSEYEKEFIQCYLMLREEKREKYRQRWLERTAYLWARENDIPKGRGADEEKVSLDRLTVKDG